MKPSELPKSDILPAGPYRVGVKSIEKAIGKKSGSAYLKLAYQVTDGSFKKRVLFDNISLTPQVLWRVRAFLEAIDQLEIELPIEKGADGGLEITDDDVMTQAIQEAATGREMIVEVNEEPEANGYPAKNNVVSYSSCKSGLAPTSRWDE